jgi:hypothetical protein
MSAALLYVTVRQKFLIVLQQLDIVKVSYYFMGIKLQ